MEPSLFDTAAVLMVLAAFFGWINHRWLKLPFAIGLLLSALLASMAVLLFDRLVPELHLGGHVRDAMVGIDFTEALLHGMLSFLLFAGALHVDLSELLEKLKAIVTLATVGVLIEAALIAVASHALFAWLGMPVAFAYCMVFGALIAPTDPVAVLGIMRAAGAPRGLEVKVVGESLFNDGVGVVLFTVLLRHATRGEMGASELGLLLAEEVLGGLLIGLVFGWVAYLAMRSLDEHNLEILISVALVMGVTVVAFRLHASAPLGCVVAGLFIGNQGRRLAMSERTRDALDLVWGFIDEALNAVLFLLVGIEVLAISLRAGHLVAGLAVIPLVLFARFVSVAVPIAALSRIERFTPGAIWVLTWGGLKGGISVALALSLPPFAGREVILTATYAVVIFSIVVQGLSVGRLIRRVARSGAPAS